MKATIYSTSKIVIIKADPLDLDSGVPARIWEGMTQSGIKIKCFITYVAIDKNEKNIEQFEKELLESEAPFIESIDLPFIKIV